jgi:hypothetical protein
MVTWSVVSGNILCVCHPLLSIMSGLIVFARGDTWFISVVTARLTIYFQRYSTAWKISEEIAGRALHTPFSKDTVASLS